MCGAYSLRANSQEIAAAFDVTRVLVEPTEDIDIRPTKPVSIIIADQEGERSLDQAKWGLIPSWATDPRIGNKAFNARCETVAEKPMFRSAFQKRRCLIPASGFF